MPSASLKNRIARLEASQGEADDDLYWSAVRDREPEFMDMFGKVIRHEISLETWHQWLAENPHPTRGRPPTPEEERQAEQAWSEFHEKLAQTRERLLRADEMAFLIIPSKPRKGCHMATPPTMRHASAGPQVLGSSTPSTPSTPSVERPRTLLKTTAADGVTRATGGCPAADRQP
jgi:hypothetical protein